MGELGKELEDFAAKIETIAREIMGEDYLPGIGQFWVRECRKIWREVIERARPSTGAKEGEGMATAMAQMIICGRAAERIMALGKEPHIDKFRKIGDLVADFILPTDD